MITFKESKLPSMTAYNIVAAAQENPNAQVIITPYDPIFSRGNEDVLSTRSGFDACVLVNVQATRVAISGDDSGFYHLWIRRYSLSGVTIGNLVIDDQSIEMTGNLQIAQATLGPISTEASSRLFYLTHENRIAYRESSDNLNYGSEVLMDMTIFQDSFNLRSYWGGVSLEVWRPGDAKAGMYVSHISAATGNRLHVLFYCIPSACYLHYVAEFDGTDWTAFCTEIVWQHQIHCLSAKAIPNAEGTSDVEADIVVFSTFMPERVGKYVEGGKIIESAYPEQGVVSFLYDTFTKTMSDHYEVDSIDRSIQDQSRTWARLSMIDLTPRIIARAIDGYTFTHIAGMKLYESGDGMYWSGGEYIPFHNLQLGADPSTNVNVTPWPFGGIILRIGDRLILCNGNTEESAAATWRFGARGLNLSIPDDRILDYSWSASDTLSGSLQIDNADYFINNWILSWVDSDPAAPPAEDLNFDTSPARRMVLEHYLGYPVPSDYVPGPGEGRPGAFFFVKVATTFVDDMTFDEDGPSRLVNITFRDFLSQMTTRSGAQNAHEWASSGFGWDNFDNRPDTISGGISHTEDSTAGKFRRINYEASDGSVSSALTSVAIPYGAPGGDDPQDVSAFSTLLSDVWNGIFSVGLRPSNQDLAGPRLGIDNIKQQIGILFRGQTIEHYSKLAFELTVLDHVGAPPAFDVYPYYYRKAPGVYDENVTPFSYGAVNQPGSVFHLNGGQRFTAPNTWQEWVAYPGVSNKWMTVWSDISGAIRYVMVKVRYGLLFWYWSDDGISWTLGWKMCMVGTRYYQLSESSAYMRAGTEFMGKFGYTANGFSDQPDAVVEPDATITPDRVVRQYTNLHFPFGPGGGDATFTNQSVPGFGYSNLDVPPQGIPVPAAADYDWSHEFNADIFEGTFTATEWGNTADPTWLSDPAPDDDFDPYYYPSSPPAHWGSSSISDIYIWNASTATLEHHTGFTAPSGIVGPFVYQDPQGNAYYKHLLRFAVEIPSVPGGQVIKDVIVDFFPDLISPPWIFHWAYSNGLKLVMKWTGSGGTHHSTQLFQDLAMPINLLRYSARNETTKTANGLSSFPLDEVVTRIKLNVQAELSPTFWAEIQARGGVSAFTSRLAIKRIHINGLGSDPF